MQTLTSEEPLAVAVTEAIRGGDLPVLDALLAAGADIEAPGAVIAGGTPLADARAFGQWRAARGWSSTAPGPRSRTPRRSVCPTG